MKFLAIYDKEMKSIMSLCQTIEKIYRIGCFVARSSQYLNLSESEDLKG